MRKSIFEALSPLTPHHSTTSPLIYSRHHLLLLQKPAPRPSSPMELATKSPLLSFSIPPSVRQQSNAALPTASAITHRTFRFFPVSKSCLYGIAKILDNVSKTVKLRFIRTTLINSLCVNHVTVYHPVFVDSPIIVLLGNVQNSELRIYI